LARRAQLDQQWRHRLLTLPVIETWRPLVIVAERRNRHGLIVCWATDWWRMCHYPFIWSRRTDMLVLGSR
jgi:hypothetical protein